MNWPRRSTPEANMTPCPDDQPSTDRAQTLGSFVRDNYEGILRFVRRLRARRGRPRGADTADVVQQACADFVRRPRAVKSDTHLRELFKCFLRNALSDQRRRERAGKRGCGEAQQSLPATPSIPAPSEKRPSKAAASAEMKQLLRHGLQQLPPQDRHLIYMRVWDQANWARIAEQLDLASEDAARMRYSRALSRLREHLPEHGAHG